MEDKREDPRFRIKQLIGYHPSREEYFWAEGLDLSRSGISCVSNEAVDAMTNVFFMLSVPGPEGEHPLRGEGYTAHSHMEDGKCRFGIKIERIFEEDKPIFDAYLARLEAGGGSEARPES